MSAEKFSEFPRVPGCPSRFLISFASLSRHYLNPSYKSPKARLAAREMAREEKNT
jgi:hypothetical protein